MKFFIFKPSIELMPYVKQYWAIETELSDGFVMERVTPQSRLDLVFHYKKPLHVKRSNGEIHDQFACQLSGLSNAYADVFTEGEIGMICAEFFPHTACLFFDFPLSAIQDESIALPDIDRAVGNTVQEKLLEANDMPQRISVINQFLLEKIRHVPAYDLKPVYRAIDLLEQTALPISTNKLASEIGIGSKSLERRFSAFVGKSPKQFSQILRFNKIAEAIKKPLSESLTSCAYAHGFYDQAHFIHDFKKFSGYTPKQFQKLYNQTG